MIVICKNDFPIGVLPGATEEQAEAFTKKMRADSDAATPDPRQVRPVFHWHDVPEMKACEQQSEARGEVKVGDRVRAIRDGSAYYRKGDCGTVLSIDRDGDFWVRWDNPIVPDAGYGWFIYQHNCERITQQPATADEAAVGAAEDMVLDAIERRESSAPVGVEASYHPCTSILIEGLKRLEGGSDVLAEWDRARAKADTALAQQPAATAAKDAEIEVLLAELDFRDSVIATHAADTREYQKRISQAEARAKQLVEVLRNSADALERIAFAIRAPNAHTPQLVELAIAMRAAALRGQEESHEHLS